MLLEQQLLQVQPAAPRPPPPAPPPPPPPPGLPFLITQDPPSV